MKILIADDHAIVRRGIRLVLADAFPGSTFGEAMDYDEAMALACKSEWEVAIVDHSLADRNGLEVVTELKKLRRNLPLIVFSFKPASEVAAQCIRAGASAYLSKSDSLDQIAAAVRTVVYGRKKFITPEVTECLALEVANPTDVGGYNLLSPREVSVLMLIASGKSLTQIGVTMRISVKTVSTYRNRILLKMGTHSNADLVRYVVEHKLS
jgi:DNA-binding NarL/FixJ family response regulator